MAEIAKFTDIPAEVQAKQNAWNKSQRIYMALKNGARFQDIAAHMGIDVDEVRRIYAAGGGCYGESPAYRWVREQGRKDTPFEQCTRYFEDDFPPEYIQNFNARYEREASLNSLPIEKLKFALLVDGEMRKRGFIPVRMLSAPYREFAREYAQRGATVAVMGFARDVRNAKPFIAARRASQATRVYDRHV